MDFYGSDMSLTSTDDLEGCIADCANTVGCKSVSWSTGTCYMKNAIPKGDYNQWVQGISRHSYAVVKRLLTGCRRIPFVLRERWKTSVMLSLHTSQHLVSKTVEHIQLRISLYIVWGGNEIARL
jgi:hypothetical protein